MSLSGTKEERAARISYQGQSGAFSHLACRRFYPALSPLPCGTFDEALERVFKGEADCTLIPIENRLGGRVAEIHRLLAETRLFITAEHFMPIHHCLLGIEGARLGEVRRVLSHPQALSQCRTLIETLGLEGEPRLDTAGAAQEVAARGDSTCAAIASSLAGELYELQVLKERTEDTIGNTTRFVAMAREERHPAEKDRGVITSLWFRTRSVPAALYKALGGFATNNVNLLRLESYVRPDSAAEFYIEVEGHPSQTATNRALEELQMFSQSMRVLGSYKADASRPR